MISGSLYQVVDHANRAGTVPKSVQAAKELDGPSHKPSEPVPMCATGGAKGRHIGGIGRVGYVSIRRKIYHSLR